MTRLAAVVFCALVSCGVAQAYWPAAGSGGAAGAAQILPAGNVPSATVSASDVTLTWAASVFPGGAPVPGYVVRRYDAGSGAEATVLAGCAGLVTPTTCIENSVPPGTWRYTITAAAGNWRGLESAQSSDVVVP